MFRLVQLSDCHLSEDPDASYRGENADANLKRLLPAVRALRPDGLVLSGDVSEDAALASYRRVRDLLDGISGDIAWLPGNHDDRGVMEAAFSAEGFHAGPVLERAGWQIVLLDSAVTDRPEGHLDVKRLAPLDQLDGQRPALVFVHHQPVPVNAPWIDKYPLVDADQLWDRLDPAVVRAVAFGHVHQAFRGQKNGIACLSAPSTVANSQSETEKFTPDPTGPKARWFNLHPNGDWQTGLISAG